MVTIVPLQLDEDFIRDALQAETGRRLESAMKELKELVADLQGGMIVDRTKYERAFTALQTAYDRSLIVLEYAGAFITAEEQGNGDEAE